MQILFNKTIEQCRQLGARGGRAYARNLRLRQSQTPVPPVAQLPAPPLETVHQASLRLDAQFPWLAEASASRPRLKLPLATSAVLANPVQFTIGGQPASVAYAGLVGAGLYQFNVAVPNIANGDAAIVAQIGGAQTQTGVSITVQQ